MNLNARFDTQLMVVVPGSGAKSVVDPGSGIVALKSEGFYRVYYEGNRFGASNMHSIEGRLIIAASRLLTAAPTIAFHVIAENEFKDCYDIVGNFIYEGRTLTISEGSSKKWSDWVSKYDQK